MKSWESLKVKVGARKCKTFYITGGRRNPELPGAGGAPPGTMLNPKY